jgi:hypothetical protein
MELHQIKKFLHLKETINRIKRQPAEWEKIFASYSLGKELTSRVYKKLQKLNKRTNNPIHKWINEWTVLRSTNSQKKHEEMFNALSHKGNANQNDTETKD